MGHELWVLLGFTVVVMGKRLGLKGFMAHSKVVIAQPGGATMD